MVDIDLVTFKMSAPLDDSYCFVCLHGPAATVQTKRCNVDGNSFRTMRTKVLFSVNERCGLVSYSQNQELLWIKPVSLICDAYKSFISSQRAILSRFLFLSPHETDTCSVSLSLSPSNIHTRTKSHLGSISK